MREPVTKPTKGTTPNKPAASKPAAVSKPAAADKPAASKPAPAKRKKPVGTFGNLPLSPEILKALDAAAYVDPTPVQAGVIPRALEGVDLMAQAQTGTGKTAAFAIPILERLELGDEVGDPQALILVPTRELAVQVRDEIVKIAADLDVEIVALYGGKPLRKQTEQLRAGVDVVVGTPGRVLDHIARRTLILSDLRMVVLDEADRMLDIGFRPDIEKILRRCPKDRQTLLLSATIAPPVRRLAEQYMHNPEVHNFSPKDLAVETIEQFYFTVDPEKKFDLLVELLRREKPRQAIVFCRTKRGTDAVYNHLGKKFEDVGVIHGDLQQRVRDRAMERFRGGKTRYLVATDVVGRGIDVSGISHIINYDIPEFSDDYVHRVGRTGRMGREGVAYTFVTPEEGKELTRIEMRINRLLKRDEIPGFDSFLKPEEASSPEAGAPEPAAPKPVFGRRPSRRVRRAL
jgi:ATP-dependent RNA helicase DeaD